MAESTRLCATGAKSWRGRETGGVLSIEMLPGVEATAATAL